MVIFDAFQGVDDVNGADRAVEMAFVVGVGLDRNALPPKLVGQGPQAGQPRLLDLLQLRAMLLHHPLVVLGGHSGQAVREQIVHGVAGPDGHHVALLAQVLDRLDQQQFDAPIGSLGQPLAAVRNAGQIGSFGHRDRGQGSGVRGQSQNGISSPPDGPEGGRSPKSSSGGGPSLAWAAP